VTSSLRHAPRPHQNETFENWSAPVAPQVVNNPVLDRSFTAPNGSTFPNPIHANAWGSLRNLSRLGMSMARFVPWYPYPRKAVAELERPEPGRPLSWNFSLLLPQARERKHVRRPCADFAPSPCC
jgi:hypothetical protein